MWDGVAYAVYISKVKAGWGMCNYGRKLDWLVVELFAIVANELGSILGNEDVVVIAVLKEKKQACFWLP